MSRQPARKPKPALAGYLFDREIGRGAAAKAVGCSREHLRRLCLPFGHPHRQVPGEHLAARIERWTNGEVKPGSFYAPADLVLSELEAA